MMDNDLGARLKNLRQRKGFSVRGLARLAGCSASCVSQVENNQASPSIAMLAKICAALKISVVDFLSDDPVLADTVTLSLDETELPLAMVWKGVRIRHLFPANIPKPFTALQITLDPGAEAPSRSSKRSINEMAIVLEGEIELTVGSETFLLKRREAAHFDLSMPHSLRNVGKHIAEVLMVHRQPFQLFEQETEDLIWSRRKDRVRVFR